MKKKYINPTLKAVKIQAAHILAGSLKSMSGVDGMTKGEDMSSGSAGSRRNRFWDDDDED